MHVYALTEMFTRNLESRTETAVIGNSASSFTSRARRTPDTWSIAGWILVVSDSSRLALVLAVDAWHRSCRPRVARAPVGRAQACSLVFSVAQERYDRFRKGLRAGEMGDVRLAFKNGDPRVGKRGGDDLRVGLDLLWTVRSCQ
jgi:hypothetical protein